MRLLVFTAQWCEPCQRLKSVLFEFQDELKRDLRPIDIIYIDIDADHAMTKQHKIRTLPTAVFFDGPEEVARLTGLVGIDKLRDTYDKHTRPNKEPGSNSA